MEDKLDLWLIQGAERFRRDPEVCHALVELAKHQDSRKCLVLLAAILETPGLAERLLAVLKPEAVANDQRPTTNGSAQPRAALHPTTPKLGAAGSPAVPHGGEL
jgi:hypothetical protein